MAPLRDTMDLVNDESRELSTFIEARQTAAECRAGRQLLRRYVQQLEPRLRLVEFVVHFAGLRILHIS